MIRCVYDLPFFREESFQHGMKVKVMFLKSVCITCTVV